MCGYIAGVCIASAVLIANKIRPQVVDDSRDKTGEDVFSHDEEE